MRIACLQFGPSLGQSSSNRDRANAILGAADPQKLDLIVLPELAFAGYNHPSLSAITPHLEPTSRGPSTDWAKSTAAYLNCIVTVGYAELDTTPFTSSAPREGDTEQVVAYNSTVTVSPSGSVLAHYRKTHLFMTDETWAQPSPQGWLSTPLTFAPKTQPKKAVKASFGICMDLNPHKFQAPWTDFEFASHALASQTEILILSMAWLTNLDSLALVEEKEEPDLGTLNYWIERLRPLVMADKEVLVVCANRCGEEPGKISSHLEGVDGVRYAGSSWVGLVGRREVRLWGILGRAQEDVLVVDTADEPRWAVRMD